MVRVDLDIAEVESACIPASSIIVTLRVGSHNPINNCRNELHTCTSFGTFL